MQKIIFKEKRENHFYAKKNDKGQYELVEPKRGEECYEFAAVAGG